MLISSEQFQNVILYVYSTSIILILISQTIYSFILWKIVKLRCSLEKMT